MNDSAPTTAQDHRLKRRKIARTTLKLVARRGMMGLGKNIAVCVLDITEDGIGFHVSEELKRGELIELEISKLGQSRSLKFMAEVCWCCQLLCEEDADPIYQIGARLRKRIPYADLTALY